MKPNPRRFRIELAVNLHAAPIPKVNPNLRIFPLHNALIDITEGEQNAKPAWYSRLGVGDELSFRLVDLSNRRLGSVEPDYPHFALAELIFNNPTTGRPASPFTETILEWQLSDRLEDQPSPVFSQDPQDHLPTWNLIGYTLHGEQVESVCFAPFEEIVEGEERTSFRAFELAVVVKMVQGGWVNHYVFDPEMIISETDNEGDGSGKRS